mmetsp:Transcript_85175/g.237752  ORF Transcript_85175/g.237752 Transcript_85175/m.237752 type:complete len:227 (+) Transcript_85175:2506-3186(+)
MFSRIVPEMMKAFCGQYPTLSTARAVPRNVASLSTAPNKEFSNVVLPEPTPPQIAVNLPACPSWSSPLASSLKSPVLKAMDKSTTHASVGPPAACNARAGLSGKSNSFSARESISETDFVSSNSMDAEPTANRTVMKTALHAKMSLARTVLPTSAKVVKVTNEAVTGVSFPRVVAMHTNFARRASDTHSSARFPLISDMNSGSHAKYLIALFAPMMLLSIPSRPVA